MSKRRGAPVSRRRTARPAVASRRRAARTTRCAAEAARVLERTLQSRVAGRRLPRSRQRALRSARRRPAVGARARHAALAAAARPRARARQRPAARSTSSPRCSRRCASAPTSSSSSTACRRHAVVNEAVEHAHAARRTAAARASSTPCCGASRATRARRPGRSRSATRCAGWRSSSVIPTSWSNAGGAASARTRTRRLLEANNRPKPMHLLAFRDRGGRELLAESLIDEGCEVEASSLSPLGLKVRSGSPLADRGLPPRRLLRAGRGGAGGGAAAAAARPASACSTSPPRPAARASRCQAIEPRVECVLADAAPDRLGIVRAQPAPAAALGAGRRRRRAAPAVAPPLRSRGGRRAVHRHRHAAQAPRAQVAALAARGDRGWRRRSAALVEASSALVRPGGLLVVITCSLEEEENEQVMERFLSRHRDFHPAPLDGALGGAAAAPRRSRRGCGGSGPRAITTASRPPSWCATPRFDWANR